MPRARPQLSITLPKNFTFHYQDGEEPKTPEQTTPAPPPQSPQAYRIKRRLRPKLGANTYVPSQNPAGLQDVPIPTIETPISAEPSRPTYYQRATEPPQGYLAPAPLIRPFMTAPRTPSAQRGRLEDAWRSRTPQQDVGESISRPLSACSLLSDSSDDSNGSSVSRRSQGGSCTSPESDAPDPFKFPSARKSKLRSTILKYEESQAQRSQAPKAKSSWTTEMDKHLMATYLTYLQDPTVTPFKMLPGTVPPLGVCHRVAREARKTWRGSKKTSHGGLRDVNDEVHAVKSNGSPDTIKACRSGSVTPTEVPSKVPMWPKTGSSTRRRLRELCRKKPTIAPHYQRLMQTRSPSPFSSSPRSNSQTHSSPARKAYTQHSPGTSFNTREVQLSLTTSTATTMQRDGPLAQLTHEPPTGRLRQSQEWFNEPPVPFASPATIPSDLTPHSPDHPQLGSPFGHHTWGPSRTGRKVRPSTTRMQSDDTPVVEPSLKSPVKLHETFPYPSILKRRAQHQLEDELSPGGTDIKANVLESLFGGPVEGRHRRVRSRGFSLGDVFTPPNSEEQMEDTEEATTPAPNNTVDLPATAEGPRRLGSPFSGNCPRITRGASRHMASASLSAYNSNTFSSIDEDMKRRLGF